MENKYKNNALLGGVSGYHEWNACTLFSASLNTQNKQMTGNDKSTNNRKSKTNILSLHSFPTLH